MKRRGTTHWASTDVAVLMQTPELREKSPEKELYYVVVMWLFRLNAEDMAWVPVDVRGECSSRTVAYSSERVVDSERARLLRTSVRGDGLQERSDVYPLATIHQSHESRQGRSYIRGNWSSRNMHDIPVTRKNQERIKRWMCQHPDAFFRANRTQLGRDRIYCFRFSKIKLGWEYEILLEDL